MRFSYQLTEKGRSLLPVLKAASHWGLTYIADMEAKIKI
ncbi:winged helix-turn-helix transcriptional regulator [Nitrosomonas marina]|nr:winged helix-turn-helix transcriptional regulator [Nitrosomonas marina]